MSRTPVTARDVTNWLKNNPTINGKPTRIPDGVRATGYKGPPLATKAGNLSNNRDQLRLAKRGNNGDGERRRLLKERPPQNAQERNQNRRQRYMRDKLNKQYGKGRFVIDHKYSLNRLGQELWGLGDKLKIRRINRIEAVEGPVGNRPQNRRIISAARNEQLRQAERAGQQNKPKSKAPMRFTPAVDTGLPGVVSFKSLLANSSARTVDTLPGAPHIFIP